MTSRSHFDAYHLPLLRLLPLALAFQSWACSADGTISDASTDNSVTSDGGSGAPDLGPDAPLDQGEADQGAADQGAADQGAADQAMQADAGALSDGGTATTPGWSAGDNMYPGPVATRVTSSVFADGRLAVLFETSPGSNVLRALAWTGAETGPWTDLGVANAGLPGALAPANNLDDLHLRMVHVGTTELLAVFQQNGGIYSNYYNGSSWGTPSLVSSSLSTVTLAGDGGTRAILVYGVASQVTARFYDSVSHSLGPEQVVADAGRELDLPLGFLSRAAIDAQGNATVFFRDRATVGGGGYSVHGYRRAAVDSSFASELPVLSGLNSPDRLCAASNAAGDVVFSFNERFTNTFGTFDRVRHVYRDAVDGLGAVSDTSAAGLIPNVDSCAISASGDAVIFVVNNNMASRPFVPIRYTNAVASVGAPLDVIVSVTGSRPQGSMTSGGLSAVSYFRTDDRVEVALEESPGGGYVTGPFLSLPNVINTSLDQLFKTSQRLDDGRFVLLYQSGQNHLRYAVLD